MTPKIILVTGCAGFIGSNFVKQFKKQFPDTIIVGVDNLSTGRKDALDKDITFYKGSICTPLFLDKIFKKHKPEYVFHFAALPRVSYSIENPAETSFVNIYGTVLLLEKCRDNQVKRFIYSSSSSVYGGTKEMPTKETCLPNPISPYALQKYAGEPFCKIFSNLYGVDTVCLRYFNVFGPGQYGNSPYSTVISAWLENIYFPTNKKAFLEGNGKQTRDFCYVDNVVQANIKAMIVTKKLCGKVFNIGNGEQTSLLKVKNMIEEYAGQQIKLDKRPPRLGDVLHTQADIYKAQKQLGYEPSVSFEEGLKLTIRWFESRKS